MFPHAHYTSFKTRARVKCSAREFIGFDADAWSWVAGVSYGVWPYALVRPSRMGKRKFWVNGRRL